jgi:hypothetical protein
MIAGSILASSTTMLPGNGTLNLRNQWDVPSPNIELALWARNALARRYMTAGTAFGGSAGVDVAFPGAPQTFDIDSTYRF